MESNWQFAPDVQGFIQVFLQGLFFTRFYPENLNLKNYLLQGLFYYFWNLFFHIFICLILPIQSGF